MKNEAYSEPRGEKQKSKNKTIICKNALRDSFPISPRDRGTKSKSTVDTMKRVTCGIYARVSTRKQETDLQLTDLRKYVERMGWTFVEYVEKAPR